MTTAMDRSSLKRPVVWIAAAAVVILLVVLIAVLISSGGGNGLSLIS